jgi:vitamin B12 transporter
VPRLKAGAYTTVNLAAAYEIDERVAAFARIDNLLDRRYEDPTGFQRPGLGVFVGVRLRFEPS